METEKKIFEKARDIRLLLMDCDGVLTDGRLYFTAEGEVMKTFHVRDGQGLALWHRAGCMSGIISGRDSGGIIRARADELGISIIRTGSEDKARDLDEILLSHGIGASETAFIGDDLGDIGIMNRVGLPIAVADAATAVINAALYVTTRTGGNASVREVIDLLLNARQ